MTELNRRCLQPHWLHIDPPASISGVATCPSVLNFLTFLPQRWLATYFVFVDLLLVTQYAYYYKTPKRSLSALNRIRSASSPGRMDRSASRYRTISAVASNVAAAAAAAAAQQDGHRPPSVRYSQQSDQHHLHERSSSGVSERLVDGDPGYSDEGNSPMLADSYHSDGGREASRKRVSWSIERHRDRAASVGRTPTALHIPTDLLSDFNAQSHEHALNEPVSPAVSNRGSRASRRGSTMVFLGAWALFGIGTLTSGRTGMSMSTTDTGRVLVSGHNLESSTPFYYSHPDTFLSNPSVNQLDTLDLDSAYPRDDSYDKSSPPEQPSSTQVLGRIFAWLCTTLYLTSRLPQIWKNVRDNNSLLSFFIDILPKVCKEISRSVFFFTYSSRLTLIHNSMAGAFHVSLRFCFSRKRILCCIYPIVTQELPSTSTGCTVY